MKTGKKMMKYQEGGMASKQPPISQEDIDRMMMEGESEYQSRMNSTDRKARQKKMEEKDMKKKAAKKPEMMMGGGMAKGYKSGGKVRGTGCAKKGVRPCKMM